MLYQLQMPFKICILRICFIKRNLSRYVFLQEQFSEVLDAMFEVLVKPQDHIIDQGEDGDNFYVIEK